MNQLFRDALEQSPVIAAIKDDEGLARCLHCDSRIIFILYGDILTIPDIVARVKESGRIAMVHIDLIHGLQSREIAVDFIHKYTNADGIISTKGNLISRAKELGMYTVLRFFVIDSMAYAGIMKQLTQAKPDVIEILPGPMPSVIARIVKQVRCPVIAGGLVTERDEVIKLLEAGASCISSTNPAVWEM